MGFTTSILPLFVLFIGSPCPAQAGLVDLVSLLRFTACGMASRDLPLACPFVKTLCPTLCQGVAVPVSPAPMTPGDACPITTTGWIRNNANCYYFSADNPDPEKREANWLGAKAACERIISTTGANTGLAELGDPANLKSDNWLMHQISLKGQEVWLGARVPAKANKYSNTGGEDNMQSWRGPGVEPNVKVEDDVYNWIRGDRVLALHDIYWGPKQPNNAKREQQNCLSTKDNEGTHGRHYFNDENCVKGLHYVCQLF